MIRYNIILQNNPIILAGYTVFVTTRSYTVMNEGYHNALYIRINNGKNIRYY